jgi:arsenite methyltransferase
MSGNSDREIKAAVVEKYRRAALSGGPEQACCSSSCCGGGEQTVQPQQISSALGYSPDEMEAAPDGANLGLGCGNPQAIAGLKPGERVLDLGSGGGFDCFLAGRQVGPNGWVIGVDMTPEMIARARENAEKVAAENVSFRLGEIEHLPVADASVDVIISNCVINLAADKRPVYGEAMRALAPGGRLAISDVVSFEPMPAEMKKSLELWAGCAAGASLDTELHALLAEIGFKDIKIDFNPASADFIKQWAPESGLENYIASAAITAFKPKG